MKLVSNVFPRLLPLAVVLAVSTVWSEPPRAEVNTKLPDYVIKEFGMPPAIPEGPLPEALQLAVNTAFIEAMKQRSWEDAQTKALDQITKGKDSLEEHLLNNVYFDTCVYDPRGMRFLFDVIPTDNLLFASEMIGAVRGADPETGYDYDDTKRHIDQLELSDEVRNQVFEENARKVYSQLDRILKERGL